MSRIIFSSQENSCMYALKEFKKINSEIKLIDWLKPGVGLIEINDSFHNISNKILDNKAVFIRHIFPVLDEIKINQDENDLNLILNAILNLIDIIDKDKTFSVQCKIIESKEKGPYKKFHVNSFISEYLESKMFKIDIKDPFQVISIVLKDNLCYIGISQAKLNLSNWTLGEHRFKHMEDQISRAEFKLMEAIDTFKIDLTSFKNALDLGASPGGWTKVLLDYGLRVVAVDPADLNEDLKKNKNVHHFRGLAQDYLKISDHFDIIVNDMRMDPIDSCKLMIELSKHLTRDGIVIMTLKLPHKNIEKILHKSINILIKLYKIEFARQLFHNRSEVTLIIRHKS